MGATNRNWERKRHRPLISTEWCQIDLFLLNATMNMPYISIQINYIYSSTRGPRQGPNASTTDLIRCVSAHEHSASFSPAFNPLSSHHCLTPKNFTFFILYWAVFYGLNMLMVGTSVALSFPPIVWGSLSIKQAVPGCKTRASQNSAKKC